MTILFDATRPVKSARPTRRFAQGLSFARRADHTAADAAWWAAHSPTSAEGFTVVGPADAELERYAQNAADWALLALGCYPY